MKSTVRAAFFLTFLVSACSSTEYNSSPPVKSAPVEESTADTAPVPQTFAKVELPKRENLADTSASAKISAAANENKSAAGNSNEQSVAAKSAKTKIAPAPLPPPVGTMVSTIGETIEIQPQIDLKKWKKISDEDDIKGYQQILETEDHVAFRGEMIIPAPLKRVATVLSNDSVRKDWVDSFADSHVIHLISELDRTEYNHIKVSWPFEDRDFVYRAQVKPSHHPNTILLTMSSVDEPGEPKQKGIVRGEIVYSYYYLQELPNGLSTRVVVEMSVDPKGAIPKWLVTLAQKKWPHNTLRDLKKLSAREDLVVPAYIQEYFSSKE